MTDMDNDELAHCLEKLGHPTRLRIYRLLVRAGHAGLPVGAIQSHMGVPGSTLSHHLSNLVAAGLIRQLRDGRVLHCIADYARMDSVIAAMTDNCCVGVDGPVPEDSPQPQQP